MGVNIRMDLGEVGWGDVDWMGLAKDINRLPNKRQEFSKCSQGRTPPTQPRVVCL
jgi:hypothetical protein